jgi:hypothetical protein
MVGDDARIVKLADMPSHRTSQGEPPPLWPPQAGESAR